MKELFIPIFVGLGSSENLPDANREARLKFMETPAVKVVYHSEPILQCKMIKTEELVPVGTFFRESLFDEFKKNEVRLKKIASLAGGNYLFVKANIIKEVVEVEIYEC